MLSEIFPMIKAISAFFSFLTEIINELYSAKKINEFIIGIDKEKKTINIKKNKIKVMDSISIINNNKHCLKNIDVKNKFEVKKNKNELPKYFEDSSKLFCIPNNNNKEIIRRKSVNTVGLSPNLKNSSNSHKSEESCWFNNNIYNLDHVKKIKFPLWNYCIGLFLIKFWPKKLKSSYISKKFSKSFILYTKLIDISSYISLYRQFELFKNKVTNKIILNEEELNKKEDIFFKNKRFLINNRIKNSNKMLKSLTLINNK